MSSPRFVSALAGLSLLLLLASRAPAQEGSMPACQLLMPSTVQLGDTWNTCIIAPPDTVAFLLIAGDDGPTPSKFGPLSIGAPLLAVYVIAIGPTGMECFDHLVHCDPNLVGMVGFFQFVDIDPSDPDHWCVSNPATLTVQDGDCVEPGDFVTFTQGGWGTECNGGNPGCLRDENFDSVYPHGVIVGDQDGPDGDSDYALLFTNSLAVQDFLPAGKSPGVLDADQTNPQQSSAGVFAGQLLSAMLSVDFDAAGVFDSIKSDDTIHLGDLVFAKGVDSDLIGMTVNEVIHLSNKVISGDLAALDLDGDGDDDVSVADLSDALDAVNNNFDGGVKDNGVLELP